MGALCSVQCPIAILQVCNSQRLFLCINTSDAYRGRNWVLGMQGKEVIHTPHERCYQYPTHGESQVRAELDKRQELLRAPQTTSS